MINIFSKNKLKGFSLIEVLLSMAIFTLIIGGVAIFSIRTIQAHTRSRAMKIALQNARFAIEFLSKTLRTSYYVQQSDEKPGEIFFIDNRDFSKYCFKFDNDKLMVYRIAPPKIFSDDSDAYGPDDVNEYKKYKKIGSCDDVSTPGASETAIIGGTGKVKATGRFIVKQTNLVSSSSDSEPFARGFVQLVVNIDYNQGDNSLPTDSSSLVIQSGISIRDYEASGVPLKKLINIP